MGQDQNELLRRKIQQLESEIAAREKDLARFRSELLTANQRLEGLMAQLKLELKSAHAIQKVLVPTEFPHIPGFEFSSRFIASGVSGGDYFDIFEHEDAMRFGLIVASSSGYAMSALFLSVLLKFTGQIEARRASEPHIMLQTIAKEIQTEMQEAALAEIFYSVIDRRNFQLSYASLGAITAFHYIYSNSELKILPSHGESLVKNRPAPLVTSQKVSLNPRDRLIVCTRGLTEVKNAEGEPYGVHRLSRSILEGPKSGVHEIRNQILFELNKFAGGLAPQRDQTVLVVEVKDKVLKLARS